MGYETQFDLSVESYPNENKQIPMATLNDLDDMLSEETPLMRNSNTSWYTDWKKWYQPEEEIALGKISEKFPNLLFTLKGHGEEDDYWVEYFQNGQLQTSDVRLVWDDFDPTSTESYQAFVERNFWELNKLMEQEQ